MENMTAAILYLRVQKINENIFRASEKFSPFLSDCNDYWPV